MKIKVFGAIAAIALLAACSHNEPVNSTASTGTGTQMSNAGGPAPGSEEDLIRVGDRVFFETAHNTLSPEAQATLDKQADWMAKYPNVTVQVAGNCDDRGTEEYNLALGQRRANATRDYLVAKGVAGTRITMISYGKDRPTALGDDDQSWSQNRNAITSVK